MSFLQILPSLILSCGLVVVSLNCLWLCKRIIKLELAVFNLEHPSRPAHFNHVHFDRSSLKEESSE